VAHDVVKRPLAITADSDVYYRGSLIQLDGQDTPQLRNDSWAVSNPRVTSWNALLTPLRPFDRKLIAGESAR